MTARARLSMRTARYKVARQRGEIAERVVGVRVVDDDREGLAAVNALETSGNAGEVGDPLGDRIGRTVAAKPAAAAASTL